MKKNTPPDPDARERILQAATECFAASGYDGTRIDEIAERAGVNKALLYYHVGDKQALYDAVLTSTIDRVLAALSEALAPELPPAGKFQAILETFARLGTENGVFIPVVMREIASGGAHMSDAMLLKMSSVFRIVAGVLAEGTASGDFRPTDPLLTHVSIVGSTMFLVASRRVRERVATIAGLPIVQHTPAEISAHVRNLFLYGLEGTPKAAAASPKARSKKSSRSQS
jgi:TetR/AcrR family transcriptional regulator